MITLPGRMPLQPEPTNAVEAFPDGSANIVIYEREQDAAHPVFKIVIEDPAGHVLFEDGNTHVFNCAAENSNRIESRFILDARDEPLPPGTLTMHILRDGLHASKKMIQVERTPFLRKRREDVHQFLYVVREEIPLQPGISQYPVRFYPVLGSAPYRVVLNVYNRLNPQAVYQPYRLGPVDRFGFSVDFDPHVQGEGYVLVWAAW